MGLKGKWRNNSTRLLDGNSLSYHVMSVGIRLLRASITCMPWTGASVFILMKATISINWAFLTACADSLNSHESTGFT